MPHYYRILMRFGKFVIVLEKELRWWLEYYGEKIEEVVDMTSGQAVIWATNSGNVRKSNPGKLTRKNRDIVSTMWPHNGMKGYSSNFGYCNYLRGNFEK